MSKRILVVDDERHIVRLVKLNLERAGGYDVLTAYDGIEALGKVKTESPDMVVLDIMMPRMDGYEVLRNLQADPSCQNIPVIMLTGKDQDADFFKAWASGLRAYMTKPFDPQELLTFIQRIFEADQIGYGDDTDDSCFEV